MIKQGEKKSWTFLQIQLPLHHLIQSNKFAFCLHPVFRGPVNKTGRINLMCFHGYACPPLPVCYILFGIFEFSWICKYLSCADEIKMLLEQGASSRDQTRMMPCLKVNLRVFVGDVVRLRREQWLTPSTEAGRWDSAQLHCRGAVGSRTWRPCYLTWRKASRRWSRTRPDAFNKNLAS